MKNYRLATVLVFLSGAILLLTSGCPSPKARWDWTVENPPPQLRTPYENQNDSELEDWQAGDLGEWEKTMKGAPSTLPGDLKEVEGHQLSNIVIYFAFDRSTIGTTEQAKLERIADYLLENPQYHLVIEGHCDERGSAEYNRGLGERRALAVENYLMDLRISAARLNTVSYGFERPVIANAETEAEHAKNRRVEFVVGVKP